MTMAMELIRHIAGLYSGKAIKGDFTQVFITGNEIWMAQQVLAEQAEGVQGERERFEVEMLELCLPIERDSHGAYVSDHVRHLWSGWELRAALAQPSPARCQCCGYLVTDSEHRGCLRSAYPVVVTLNDSGAILAVTRQDAEGSVLSVIAEAQSSPKCATCNDNGRIGGPSFYAPDEGGDPCPDCAQPSPAFAKPSLLKDCDVRYAANAASTAVNPSAPLPGCVAAQPSPAPELEQVERFEPAHGTDRGGNVFAYMIDNEAGEYMEFAQHDRIVGALWANIGTLMETRNGLVEEIGHLHSELCDVREERDAAQAKLAAMEKQEPVAAVSEETFSSDGTSDIITRNLPIGTTLYAAPVAQAGQVLKGYVLAKQTVVDMPDGKKELGYTLVDGLGVFDSRDDVHDAIKELSLPIGWVSMTVEQLLPGRMLAAEPQHQKGE